MSINENKIFKNFNVYAFMVIIVQSSTHLSIWLIMTMMLFDKMRNIWIHHWFTKYLSVSCCITCKYHHWSLIVWKMLKELKLYYYIEQLIRNELQIVFESIYTWFKLTLAWKEWFWQIQHTIELTLAELELTPIGKVRMILYRYHVELTPKKTQDDSCRNKH